MRFFAPAAVGCAAEGAYPDDDRPERGFGRGSCEDLFAYPFGLAICTAGCVACAQADRTLRRSGVSCSAPFRGGIGGTLRCSSEGVCRTYKQKSRWVGKVAGESEIDEVSEHAKTAVKDAEG